MVAVAVKGRNSKLTRDVVAIYRAPNEDMRDIEKLAARTGYMGNYKA